MELVCPSCGRRYQIEADRLGATGRKVRCSGCGTVFVSGGGEAGAEPAAPAPDPAASVRPGGLPDRRRPVGDAGAGPLALVADEDREFRDLVCRTLQSLGCRVETTDDGESAFRFAVSRRPALMVVNVYLRKLLGVAVCEGVKGSPDLRATRVALVGSVFKSDRFVRSPGNLYGADDYFEDVIARDELRARLAVLVDPIGGLRRGGPPARSASSASAAAPSRNVPDRSLSLDDELAPGPGLGDRLDAAFDEISAGGVSQHDDILAPIDPPAEIRRLARIMLSDLKIYHPENFQRAVLERRFFETFREEMTKGKDLIVHRFPDLPERIEILAAALREGLEEERRRPAERPAGTRR